MLNIVECRGVFLKIPRNYSFSFSNSPYYAHKYFKAVDIYPPLGDKTIASPFNGKLVYYRELHGEHICGFKTGEYYIRILHLKPYMDLGEEVGVGEVLGEPMDSPTFCPWTDHHIHVEIRDKPEFLRARGGLELDLAIDLVELVRNSVSKVAKLNKNNYVEGEIILVDKNRYILVKPRKTCLGLTPIAIEVNGVKGFLEGGIPYYGYGGIIVSSTDTSHSIKEEIIYLYGEPIGYIDYTRRSYLHIQLYKDIVFYTREIPLKGIGLYLNNPYIKLVPRKWSNNCLKEGDILVLSLISLKTLGKSINNSY